MKINKRRRIVEILVEILVTVVQLYEKLSFNLNLIYYLQCNSLFPLLMCKYVSM